MYKLIIVADLITILHFKFYQNRSHFAENMTKHLPFIGTQHGIGIVTKISLVSFIR